MIRGVSVNNAAQLEAVLRYEHLPERIYLPCRVFLSREDEMSACAEKIPDGVEIFAVLPYLMREEPGMPGISDLERLIRDPCLRVDGVLAHNLESVGYFREQDFRGTLETDQQIPIWNAAAAGTLFGLLEGMHPEWTISPELSFREIRELLSAIRDKDRAWADAAGLVVYGRTVMMVSANCIRKTTGRCTGKQGSFHCFTELLRDRKGKLLPVTGDCRACYNVVRNAVPTSLHRVFGEILRLGITRIRIDLLGESADEVREILQVYDGMDDGGEKQLSRETTTGRFRTGVE